MKHKEKSDEQLPVYEVEFIPVERRLQDRRSRRPLDTVPMERRQFGRRKTDPPPDPETPEIPAAAKPRAPKSR